LSDPKDQRQKPDELELEPETVKDLEVDGQTEEDIRGGKCCGTAPAVPNAWGP